MSLAFPPEAVIRAVAGLLGFGFLLLVLVDAFESIVLPRRATRRWRVARLFYMTTWRFWSAVATRVRNSKRREAFLSVFGPLSLLLLLGAWAAALIAGFALVEWASGSRIASPDEAVNLLSDLYYSGVTFFTLGYGDFTPRGAVARLLAILEAGMGFAFLAVVIGYLPVIYAAFSRREAVITMLDTRAGSPPSAVELLRRHAQKNALPALDGFFADWERWAADLLESHLSYPVLCYYRSQHDNQSWLGSITAVLDASALVMAGIVDVPNWQASHTFALARHAAVDLAQIFRASPAVSLPPRLIPADLARLREMLSASGVPVRWCDDSAARLEKLRGLYEPYTAALGQRFLFSLPSWLPSERQMSNWQTSAWGRASASATRGLASEAWRDDVH
jgi:voltage-gated potassium channel Kch